MMTIFEYQKLLDEAIKQAQLGLSEGGIPIGAALFTNNGTLLGQGYNRRVQDNDPSMHAETNAFRNAGRRSNYSDTIMVTTLSPCWYCSGLIKQFGIGTVVIGENNNFLGAEDWLKESGVQVIVLNNEECKNMMSKFIRDYPNLWNEDIGVPPKTCTIV